jgi:hypothetical protein
MEHAYKITLPNMICVVYADSRGDAIKKYIEQTGISGEFFEKHGTCKICTYSQEEDGYKQLNKDVLLYSDRVRIAAEFEEFCEEAGEPKDRTHYVNMVTFLYKQGWLDIPRIKIDLDLLRGGNDK